jgi:hypothetical protein
VITPGRLVPALMVATTSNVLWLMTLTVSAASVQAEIGQFECGQVRQPALLDQTAPTPA